jgi:hypothetical protein
MNATLIRILSLLPWYGRSFQARLQPAYAVARGRGGRRRRGGITLIEVLVAVFVLTFGLMGIAMVIPAGRWQMVEAAKSDRSTACGGAVINDIQIRGWLDPGGWYQIRRGRTVEWQPPIDPPPLGVARNGRVIYGESFLIDPVFFQIARSASNPTVQFFPYSTRVGQQKRETRPWPHRALARRVTPAISEALAGRITTWADDLIYSLDDEGRPRQLATWAYTGSDATRMGETQGAAFPELPDDDFDSTDMFRLRANNEGKFSWAAMVTPLVPSRAPNFWSNPNDPVRFWPDPDGSSPADRYPMVKISSIPRYEVSIVVFYRRNYYCPTSAELNGPATPTDTIRERSVYARMDGGGIGGGDVLLFIHDADGLPDSHLNLRKNQWVMLKGLDRSRRVALGTTSETWPTVCKWYRVVGVDDVIDQVPDGSGGMTALTIADPRPPTVSASTTIDGRGRYVTLAGPDWQLDTTDDGTAAQFDPSTDICEAAICDDVVGVFTRVVDANSM